MRRARARSSASGGVARVGRHVAKRGIRAQVMFCLSCLVACSARHSGMPRGGCRRIGALGAKMFYEGRLGRRLAGGVIATRRSRSDAGNLDSGHLARRVESVVGAGKRAPQRRQRRWAQRAGQATVRVRCHRAWRGQDRATLGMALQGEVRQASAVEAGAASTRACHRQPRNTHVVIHGGGCTAAGEGTTGCAGVASAQRECGVDGVAHGEGVGIALGTGC